MLKHFGIWIRFRGKNVYRKLEFFTPRCLWHRGVKHWALENHLIKFNFVGNDTSKFDSKVSVIPRSFLHMLILCSISLKLLPYSTEYSMWIYFSILYMYIYTYTVHKISYNSPLVIGDYTGHSFYYVLPALLEKIWHFSLYVTDDAIAKLCVSLVK